MSRTGESGGPGRTELTLSANGTGVTAAIVSLLHGPDSTTHRSPQNGVRKATLKVESGSSYTFTKYVGIATSHDAQNPLDPARKAAEEAAAAGYQKLADDNAGAWDREWRSDIEIHGHDRLQQQVRAAKFYLLASVRQDSPWGPSPAGLSSDGYWGHVFWDNETWMWPSLLAQHPGIARSVLDYRVERLDAARAFAAEGGYKGARFPWESGLRGNDDTFSANVGRHQQHVSSCIALAFWQYWLATGDREWLAEKGWPVLRDIAHFWTSRVTREADGCCHIRGVMPPDEYRESPVDDSAYTNVSARAALRFAVEAAAVLGHSPEKAWSETADTLVVLFDDNLGIHPEYQGYKGEKIKQADVVMLSYPWENYQSDKVTRADLEYYVPRSDEQGPSMTDSIHSIVRAQLGESKGAFEATRRSVEPFVRAPYEQFAAMRSGARSPFLPEAADSSRSSSTDTPGFAGAPTTYSSTRSCPGNSRASPSGGCTGAAGYSTWTSATGARPSVCCKGSLSRLRRPGSGTARSAVRTSPSPPVREHVGPPVQYAGGCVLHRCRPYSAT